MKTKQERRLSDLDDFFDMVATTEPKKIEVKCKPCKELYFDATTGYRVMACIPVGPPPNGLELNKYGNFSVSGNGLNLLKEGVPINLKLTEAKSKYSASYNFAGLPDLSMETDKVHVNRDGTMSILCSFATKTQAQHVMDAYPNFVDMVLNGEEGQLDYKKIYNVGKKRLEEYIYKVRENSGAVPFLPFLLSIGVTDYDKAVEITKDYSNPDNMIYAYNRDPYSFMIESIKYSFETSDKIIIEHDEKMAESRERCGWALSTILKQNETETGDTRIAKEIVEQALKIMIPEAAQWYEVGKTLSNTVEHEGWLSRSETYYAEKSIADFIKNRIDNSEHVDFEWQNFVQREEGNLTEEQSKILQLMCDNDVVILTGCAGSGKSFTTKTIIDLLESKGFTYQLLAPTGIASKVLSTATGRPASTIHRWAGAGDPRDVDYVVVDELGMVSAEVLKMLIKVIPPTCKMILVFDPAQLISIGAGNVAKDLVMSRRVPIAMLTKVFRYGIGGIATIATDFRKGIVSNLEEEFDDFKYYNTNNVKEQFEGVLEAYQGYLNDGYTRENILIISPFNVGEVGTKAINLAIQEKYSLGQELEYKTNFDGKFRIGDKVICNKNTYDAKVAEQTSSGYGFSLNGSGKCETTWVFNGDQGIVLGDFYDDTSRSNCIVVEFDCGMVAFSQKEFQKLSLAYALSCHRVQGCESPAVIFVANSQHKRLLTNNLCYVAVTRAKKHLTIIADYDTIEEALGKHEETTRNTWLQEMMQEGWKENDQKST